MQHGAGLVHRDMVGVVRDSMLGRSVWHGQRGASDAFPFIVAACGLIGVWVFVLNLVCDGR
jgi:hypothetical protein